MINLSIFAFGMVLGIGMGTGISVYLFRVGVAVAHESIEVITSPTDTTDNNTPIEEDPYSFDTYSDYISGLEGEDEDLAN